MDAAGKDGTIKHVIRGESGGRGCVVVQRRRGGVRHGFFVRKDKASREGTESHFQPFVLRGGAGGAGIRNSRDQKLPKRLVTKHTGRSALRHHTSSATGTEWIAVVKFFLHLQEEQSAGFWHGWSSGKELEVFFSERQGTRNFGMRIRRYEETTGNGERFALVCCAGG